MSWFGYHPNLGDLQREAWDKALHHFPAVGTWPVTTWIPDGFVVLDLDGTEIGRHLAPEASSLPLWGARRPVGMAEKGLVIPYASDEGEPVIPPIHIPWTHIHPAFDATHFSLAAEVIVTLRLSEEAAAAVHARIEDLHG